MSAPKQLEGLFTEEQVCCLVQMPLKMLREVSRLANLGVELSGSRFYQRAEIEILREIVEGYNQARLQQLT